MNRALEKNLIDGLDRLEEGASLDAVLAAYPDRNEELRPLLQTAVQIPQLAVQPTVAAQQQSLANFLDAAAAMRGSQAAPLPGVFSLRRLLMPLASLALILLLLGFALVTIAESALPGDGLYGVKRSIEEIRLTLAREPEQILDLSQQFQEERVDEIEALLLGGRTAEILYEGEIEAFDADVWQVAGLPVEIVDETLVEGTPQVGETARVDGRTESGRLIAVHIVVLTGDADDNPLPAVIPTVETKATPQPDTLPAATPTPDPDRISQPGSARIVDYNESSSTTSVQPPVGLPFRGDNDEESVSGSDGQDVHGNQNAADSSENDSGAAGDNEDGSELGSEEDDATGNGDGDDSNDAAPGSDDEEDGNSSTGGDENDDASNDDAGNDDAGNDDSGDEDDDASNDNGGDDSDDDDGDDKNEDAGDDSGDDPGGDNGDDGGDDNDDDDDNDDGGDSGDDDGDDNDDGGDDSGDDGDDDDGGDDNGEGDDEEGDGDDEENEEDERDKGSNDNDDDEDEEKENEKDEAPNLIKR